MIATEQDCPINRVLRWICKINPMFSKRCGEQKPVSNASETNHALSLKNSSLAFFTTMKEVPQDWDRVAPKDNLFLQRTYLQLLEDHPPKEMNFCYFLFYQGTQPVGLAVGQIQSFRADRSLNKESKETPGFFNTFGRHLKEMVASKVEFVTLVCGSLLLTGEHGFYFKPTIESDHGIQLLEEGLLFAQTALEKQGTRISACLTKDTYEDNRPQVRKLFDYAFQEFTVQPSMVLDIQWSNFEEYAAALSSKYRVRMKRAFKKAVDIEKRDLSLAEIEENSSRLFALYNEIAANSGFNLVNLNEDYLAALKRAFPDRFHLHAYYLEDKLIAYYTTIHNGKEMEAHFLGYDHAYNNAHQVYLNILYDLTKDGIDLGVERVIFARTALEIKSSIGAVPIEMYCYFRHRSSFSNNFVKPLLDYLKPKVEWKQRHPFKS